jgi:hypothetical protein
MHRIDAADHDGNLFSEGNPATGTPGTKVSAAWLNAVQEELCNAIGLAGIVLNKAVSTQLRAALEKLAGGDDEFVPSNFPFGLKGELRAVKIGRTAHVFGRLRSEAAYPAGTVIMTIPAAKRPPETDITTEPNYISTVAAVHTSDTAEWTPADFARLYINPTTGQVIWGGPGGIAVGDRFSFSFTYRTAS